MSELLFIILLIICSMSIFFLYKYLDKRGLYFASIILNMITFILTFKITTIFKMNTNLGIISYISTLTVVYIYLIKYGKKDINKLLIVSLITNIVTAIFITIMNFYIPAITETISINMQGTFEYNYKILFTYPIIMAVSQYIIIKLYSYIATLQSNISISLLLTYIITGILYTIILCVISYINILSIKESVFIGVTTYIMGLIVTIINIIFINIFLSSKKVIKWEI